MEEEKQDTDYLTFVFHDVNLRVIAWALPGSCSQLGQGGVQNIGDGGGEMSNLVSA